MNPKNYGSLEACQRLVDAGIVLETDVYWRKDKQPAGDGKTYYHLCDYEGEIPAPSMAEVWRELPEEIDHRGVDSWMLEISKNACGYYRGGTVAKSVVVSNNPTDALIDLLIHIKGVDTHKSNEFGQEKHGNISNLGTKGE